MEFGIIKKRKGAISLTEWSRCIAAHKSLEPIPDSEGVNPFTQEKVVFPGEGKAYYVKSGKKVGNLSLEDGEIKTTGVPKKLCAEIAELLSAEIHEADFS